MHTTTIATVACKKKHENTWKPTSAHIVNSGSGKGEFHQRYCSWIPACSNIVIDKFHANQVIKRHADLGYMAVSVYPLATKYLKDRRLPGGVKAHEWDGFHDLIIIDEIARCGYLGVIWALTCGNSIGAPPLINFGTEEQKKRFVPSILDGTIRFCLAVTEPDGKVIFPRLGRESTLTTPTCSRLGRCWYHYYC